MTNQIFSVFAFCLICSGCINAPLKSALPDKSGSAVTRTSNIIAGQDRQTNSTAVLKSCEGRPHGSTKTGYVSKTAPAGESCQQVTAICNDGIWTDPELYDSCTPSTH